MFSEFVKKAQGEELAASMCVCFRLQENQSRWATGQLFSAHKGNGEQQTEYKDGGWATCSQLHCQ